MNKNCKDYVRLTTDEQIKDRYRRTCKDYSDEKFDSLCDKCFNCYVYCDESIGIDIDLKKLWEEYCGCEGINKIKYYCQRNFNNFKVGDTKNFCQTCLKQCLVVIKEQYWIEPYNYNKDINKFIKGLCYCDSKDEICD